MSTPFRLRNTTITALLLAALAPTAALAHPGHNPGGSLMAGLLHPLTGLDHVLMIISVSAWAALQPPKGRLLIAACLALFVLIGAMLPIPGSAALEAAIAATVIGAGLLLAMGRRWPLWISCAVSAGFALVHGFAHGAEGPGRAGFYFAGLVVATGILALATTFVATRAGERRAYWVRLAGLCSAATGVVALV
jgi:urease accessory protein